MWMVRDDVNWSAEPGVLPVCREGGRSAMTQIRERRRSARRLEPLPDLPVRPVSAAGIAGTDELLARIDELVAG
jgi:hypothetical protein